jgi:hypothetical protein
MEDKKCMQNFGVEISWMSVTEEAVKDVELDIKMNL